MKVLVELDITDCRDCPFTYRHSGHGECWTECRHKGNNRGAYENILWGCQDSFKEVPEWCPIFSKKQGKAVK